MKTKGTMKNQARQGDVFLQRVDEIPAKAKKAPRDRGKVVLAYGEVTGHSHAFGSRAVNLFRCEAESFISVGPGGALLKHEEHAPIKVPEGKYRVVIQREYTEGRIQNVAD